VRAGQAVTVRSDAFPGVDFSGRVTRMAQAVAPARIAQRGPRRPNEQDTLEVLVDLDPGTTLLPGMRVDVFFRVESTVQTGAQGGSPAAGTR
jgi:HlyD family secretion protein